MKRKPGKPRAIVDITGQRFGRLVVLERLPARRVESGTVIWWRCLCDCGASWDVIGASLRTGKTKSCGCLRRELAPTHSKHFKAVA